MPRKNSKPRHLADDAPVTAAEMKTARRFHECPPDFQEAIRRSLRGRPAGRRKEAVHLSLDIDLVEAMRKSGTGWQTRANAALRKVMKLPSAHTQAE